MLLMGSVLSHSRMLFMVVASQESTVISIFTAHGHQLQTMLSSAVFSNSPAMGMTMKLLSRNHVLKRPK